MEVRSGYKVTEVGIIPQEWRVSVLDSVANIIDPQPDHRTPPEVAGGEPYIGISDFVDDNSVDWDGSRKIIAAALDKQQASFQIRPGDIIFGKIGTIGLPKFLPTVPFRYALSANILLIQPNIESYFVMAWLMSRAVRKSVDRELHSTSQAAFGINKMRGLLIPLPPEPEQRAIAATLNDMDALLDGLERLIAKKRDLKQAAMQQLLTCQTRLPSFSGEWEVTPLERLAEIVSGGTPKTTEPSYWSGEIKWCTPTDITGCADKYLFETERTISRLGLNSSGARLLPAGSLLLCSRATIGELKIAGGEVCTNQGFKSLICKSDVSNEFLYYKLLTMKQQMIERAFGSTFLEISKANVAALEVLLPSLLEQTAIATVLSDMDAELSALEARRDKTRALKQAMMQELLTGKTRLVSPEVTHA